MHNPTRREILEAGASALAAGLTGHSESDDNISEDDPAQIRNVSKDYSEAFDQLLDIRRLQERGISFTDDDFSVSFPQEIHEVSPESYTEHDGQAPYLAEDVHDDEVLRYLTSGPVQTISFDLEEEELIQKMEAAGFENDTSYEGTDFAGWKPLHGAEDLESDNSYLEENTNIIAAANGNEIIAVPYTQGSDEHLSDALFATEIAIRTHNGLAGSYPEGEYSENKAVNAANELIEDGKLGKLENPDKVAGTLNPEDDVLGELTLQKATEEGLYEQNFEIDEKYEIAKTTELEMHTYPDEETDFYSSI